MQRTHSFNKSEKTIKGKSNMISFGFAAPRVYAMAS